MLSCVCSVIDYKLTSKCGENLSDTATFLHFDVICDLWTDARQRGIYLLNW